MIDYRHNRYRFCITIQIMKLTSKDKIIAQSFQQKTDQAQILSKQGRYIQSIQAYHKALFLREDPNVMFELAQVYQKLLDMSSASLFYRRVHYLNGSPIALERLRNAAKIRGLQLLSIGSLTNILSDTDFQCFLRRYPIFQRKLVKKLSQGVVFADYLQSCLAYLQVNQRELAMGELDSCILLDERDVDLRVLKAMISWSLLEETRGYKEWWIAYEMDRTHPEVVAFIQNIQPQVEKLFKEAKYELVERRVEKCQMKVKRGLELHPYHTQLLILSAYLHRGKEQYEQALEKLQLANKHLQENEEALKEELKSQIALTYNQMGIFLFKQSKYPQALTLFTQGLTYKPDDWGMLTNHGDCHRAMGQYVLALQDFLQAHSKHQSDSQLNFRISSIYSIRGVALFNSQNYPLALIQFQQALSFSPKYAQYLLSKAKCLIQLNRNQQAVEALEECLLSDEKLSEAAHLLNQIKEPQQRQGKNQRKIIQLSKQK